MPPSTGAFQKSGEVPHPWVLERSILLGLRFLVAADITRLPIGTFNLKDVVTLRLIGLIGLIGLIELIRTFPDFRT
ncbi:DUF1622 domain-containing protein [Arthrobacter roseus]|uniref:DUF1622 domain-containing protein n=1 Tax=Arthrobacter roseus TaxID=136274 RepID=UPI0019635665|nr:DUF1622 domain-containing protein [Arthrobacter roseus]MBM7849752.1 putative membrane protein [Arthrobacter roseus]